MSEISFASHNATDAPPLHTVRETLRSVELPTARQSPFGPVRKNQPKPPVKIPRPRKPSDIGPRPAPPSRPLTARPVAWVPTDTDVDHAIGNYGPGPYKPGGSAA